MAAAGAAAQPCSSVPPSLLPGWHPKAPGALLVAPHATQAVQYSEARGTNERARKATVRHHPHQTLNTPPTHVLPRPPAHRLMSVCSWLCALLQIEGLVQELSDVKAQLVEVERFTRWAAPA